MMEVISLKEINFEKKSSNLIKSSLNMFSKKQLSSNQINPVSDSLLSQKLSISDKHSQKKPTSKPYRMEGDIMSDLSSFRSEDIDCISSMRFEPKNDVIYNKDSFFNRAN